MNPTTDAFEQRIAALDGGVGGLALASGMQAIAVSLFNLVHAGGHIVSAAAASTAERSPCSARPSSGWEST